MNMPRDRMEGYNSKNSGLKFICDWGCLFVRGYPVKSPGRLGDFTNYTVSFIRTLIFLAISQEAVVWHKHISFQCNYLICLSLNIFALYCVG